MFRRDTPKSQVIVCGTQPRFASLRGFKTLEIFWIHSQTKAKNLIPSHRRISSCDSGFYQSGDTHRNAQTTFSKSLFQLPMHGQGVTPSSQKQNHHKKLWVGKTPVNKKRCSTYFPFLIQNLERDSQKGSQVWSKKRNPSLFLNKEQAKSICIPLKTRAVTVWEINISVIVEIECFECFW